MKDIEELTPVFPTRLSRGTLPTSWVISSVVETVCQERQRVSSCPYLYSMFAHRWIPCLIPTERDRP